MAEQVNMQLRTEAELRDEFKALAEREQTPQGEFLRQMLEAWKLNDTKVKVPSMAADIDEYQRITARQVEILTGVAERMEMLTADGAQQIARLRESHGNTVATLERQIEELKEAAKDAAEVKALRDENVKFKTKVETLTSFVGELRGMMKELQVTAPKTVKPSGAKPKENI